MKYIYRRVLLSVGLFIFVLNTGLNGQDVEKPGYTDRWLGKDKLAHFTVSLTTVGFTNHWLGFEESRSPEQARNSAVAFSFSLGLIKEAFDATKKNNHFSSKDLVADILGVICGTFLFTLK